MFDSRNSSFGFQLSEKTFGRKTNLYRRNASFDVNGFTFSAWVPAESVFGTLPFMIPTPSSSPSASPTPSTSPSMSSSPTSSKTPSPSPSESQSRTSRPSASATPQVSERKKVSIAPSASTTTILKTESVTPSSSIPISMSLSSSPSSSDGSSQTPSSSASSVPLFVSPTQSISMSPSKSGSLAATISRKPSSTVPKTNTPTTSLSPPSYISPSESPYESVPVTPSSSASTTPGVSVAPSLTPSQTITQSISLSPTSSVSPSESPSDSVMATPSSSESTTPSASVTPISTPSQTSTPSVSFSPRSSVAPSESPSESVTVILSSSPLTTPSAYKTWSLTPSQTSTPSISISPSSSVSQSETPSVAVTPKSSISTTSSASMTPSLTPSQTSTPTVSSSETPSMSLSASFSATPTSSVSSSPTQTATPSISSSPSNSPCTLVSKVDSIDRKRRDGSVDSDGDYGYFGYRVSMSRATDSGYVVTSEPYTLHANSPGKVYVISTAGNNLVELNPENNQFFGTRTAVSSDGRWIAASQYTDRGDRNGFVKIYDAQNGFLAYDLEFVPIGVGNYFGRNNFKIAVLVGGAKKEEGGESYGAVFLYDWKDETSSWEKSEELWADDNVPRFLLEIVATDEFVAASVYLGDVMIFELTGTQSQSVLSKPQDSSIKFGSSLAFGDNLLYVSDSAYNSNTGRVYVFDVLNSFTLVRVLESVQEVEYFGWSIDAADGFLIVGSYASEKTAELRSQGSAYIFDVKDSFKIIRTIWGEEAYDIFGYSVAISSDGRYVIGAIHGMNEEDCKLNGCSGLGAVYLSEPICSLSYDNVLIIKD